MSPAFAATTAVLPRTAFPAATTMVLPINNNKVNKNILQGFTEFSETLNSRAAMVGFVAALGAEILNPAHPTIVQQVESIFTTVQNLI